MPKFPYTFDLMPLLTENKREWQKRIIKNVKTLLKNKLCFVVTKQNTQKQIHLLCTFVC